MFYIASYLFSRQISVFIPGIDHKVAIVKNKMYRKKCLSYFRFFRVKSDAFGLILV